MMIFKGLKNFSLNKNFLLILFFTLCSNKLVCECFVIAEKDKDSSVSEKYVFQLKKDPVRSATYSAIMPGLGQFYNEQYWKIPIALGIIIWPSYVFYNNQLEYSKVRNEYRRRVMGLDRDYLKFANDQQLSTYLKSIERDRDLSFLIILLAYSINIIDAYVSSHLIGFDVDNISFKPNIFYNDKTYVGISIKLSL